MYIETLYARNLEELDLLVDEFMTDRIVHDVNYIELRLGWQSDIFYDNIPEGDEKI